MWLLNTISRCHGNACLIYTYVRQRESPRTNGKSTSRRSRVRYAPCPVNSSTGYTPKTGQLADAGKGDLLYPVPDPTPGIEVHDSSTWKGPGVVVEKKLSPYHYRVRLKAVISVVNHVMPERSARLGVRGSCWADQSWYTCLTANSWSSCNECKEWFHGKCVKPWPKYFCSDCTGQ